MSREPRLADALIRTALSPGRNLAPPSGLLGAISDEVRGTSQDRRWFGRRAAVRFGLQPAPAISRLAWVLIAAALLTGLLLGSMLVGARRPDRAVVVAPSPMPSPTVIAAESDILATTKAKPLPPQATCPPGSNPDAPGPGGQERPFAVWAMGFDRHADRVVALEVETARSQTWTFDVCTNTWQRMSPTEEPPVAGEGSFLYDADSDRTLAFTDTGRIWSYDLATDRWTEAGWFPEAAGIWRSPPGGFQWRGGVAALYHDPSGLVILYDGETMWAYDVDTNTLATVRQRSDPSRPAGSAVPHTEAFGQTSLGYDSRNDLLIAHVVSEESGQPETWTFDPGAGTWRLETSVETPTLTLHSGYLWPEVGTRAVFDEAAGLTLFNAPLDMQLVAYDASRRAWRTVYSKTDTPGYVGWCGNVPPVYDPVNRRIVCRAARPEGWGETAFSAATGEWRWLLEPVSSLPSWLVGGWSTAGTEPATLTMHACVVGQDCGTFTRIDDNNEHCVYSLEYRGPASDGFAFQSGIGNSFGCGWSTWAAGSLRVRLAADETVGVISPRGFTSGPMHRVDASAAPSASPLP
jgi:hypothetical protein